MPIESSMLEVIGKDAVTLTRLHMSDGSFRYIDDQGASYPNVAVNNANTQLIGQFNNQWLFGEIIRNLPLQEALPYILVCIGLVAFSGITSGLNVSLLSIDPLKIKIMESSTKPYDQKIVKRIKPIIKNQHFLLVTLLVANAAAMESLPIFLDQMVASWLAVIISVTFVLIFGEILPQALLASDPLKAGYNFAWLVRLLQILFFPVTYPVSLLLDKIIKHKHTVVFTHEEMSNLFGIISRDKEARTEFHKDELQFLDGALKLRTLTVDRQMVRWKNVKSFPYNLELNEQGLTKIWECGFSRVPVYKDHEMDIIGICLTKDLIMVQSNKSTLLGDYVRRKPVIMSPRLTMIQALNMFREKKTHLGLITKDVDIVNDCFASGEPIPQSVVFLGCLTLEDIMEQLIQERIEDEYESSIDERQIAAQRADNPSTVNIPKKPGLLPVIKRAKLRMQRKVAQTIAQGGVELINTGEKNKAKKDGYRFTLLSEEDPSVEINTEENFSQDNKSFSANPDDPTSTDTKKRLLDE